MKPLRIFVAHASDMLTDHKPHGDGLIAFEFLHRLAERGHDVHVASTQAEIKRPLHPNLKIHILNVPAAFPDFAARLVFMSQMRALFNKLNNTLAFDLVQQMNPVHAGLSLALWGIEQPIVLGTYPPMWPADAEKVGATSGTVERMKLAIRNLICRVQQFKAAAVVITSPAAFNRITSKRASRERAHIVPLGVDVSSFTPRLAVPEKPSILFLANVNIRKGIFTLLEAFEIVAAGNPDVTLTIAGSGPSLDRVKERIAAMQSKDQITLVGAVARTAVAELMRKHSLYCLPSYGEPASVTILEAMACGVPVVATAAGGSPYLVASEGGRLAPARDAVALASALNEVLVSRDLQESMGQFNRQRIEREFDWKHVLDGLEGVYSKVLHLESSVASARDEQREPFSPKRSEAYQ